MAAKVKGKRVPVGVLVGGAALAAVALWIATRTKAAQEIALTTGWNEVVYTGKSQSPEQAFASILDKLSYGVWYWDKARGEWLLVLAYIDGRWQSVEQAVMIPGGTYNIYVIMDCTWAF